jgi:hypothetical protein
MTTRKKGTKARFRVGQVVRHFNGLLVTLKENLGTCKSAECPGSRWAASDYHLPLCDSNLRPLTRRERGSDGRSGK